MKRIGCLALALVLCPAAAGADTRFEEYGAATPKRAATQLAEASCDLDVELRGAIATAEIRQRIHNPGPGALAASYEFTLPRGATVTGFAVKTDTVVESAMGVAASPPSELMESPDVLDADPGLLVALATGDEPRFRATLQPIAPDREITITTRWAVRAEVRDGALRILIPGRAATDVKLGLCHGTLRATPGPGATVDRIRVAGQETGARGVALFGIDARDTAIDVELAFAKREPILWTQTEELADGFSATVVTVLAPAIRATALTARRVLFVVDGSRSMELVGRANAAKVMRAVAGALPANAELDAIVYDRTATRAFGDWRPGTPANVAALEQLIAGRASSNGSDLAGALKLAHQAVTDGSRGQTMVVVITDGMLADDTDLAAALDGKPSTVDVHVIALEPSRIKTPGVTQLRRPVDLYGGSFVEVPVDELDTALTGVESWLRPSWVEVALSGSPLEIPPQLRAGSGATYLLVHRGPVPTLVLSGHAEAAIKVSPRTAPGNAVAAIALATTDTTAFYPRGIDDPSDAQLVQATRYRTHAERLHMAVTLDRGLAVLSSQGRVAGTRRTMVKGGGPYTRVVAVDDPAWPAVVVTGSTPPAASAIAKITLERMFRDQLQPKAYACYQRALGLAPKLVGTVHFEFHMARGEVTQVTLVGIGDAKFEACLLDAAYLLTPPLPDFTINADDQTVAHYPLTFNMRENHPLVVPGDADSDSPLDIAAIRGGVPTNRRPVKVDTSSPLGNMRPSK